MSRRALLAGVPAANSAHVTTAGTGRQHPTPLAGHRSSPRVNLVGGAANLVGGLARLKRDARADVPCPWDRRLVAFNGGAATFAAWMAASEAAWRVNQS